MKYWLMKTEPTCFSLDDLKHAPEQTTPWDGIRNYQARNYILHDMQHGDLVFFYHSNCKPPAIVGIAEIVSPAYPDYTAFDPDSDHPDLSTTPENPRWFMVDVRFVAEFKSPVSLPQLKTYPELSAMRLLQKGNRLSILPIEPSEWAFIVALSG
jgi:predicted RNA-binding protein with PUA-like domain